MGTVVSSASMSLDGYVAHPDDTPGALFDWYDNGPVEVRTAAAELTFHLSEASAAHWASWVAELGALVVGRRLFDLTDGWGGNHPLGVPVVVVTHRPPSGWAHAGDHTEFATDVGAAVARAQQIAGDATVGVAAGTVGSQCLDLGLLDEVSIDLVPVVLGAGRPYVTCSTTQVLLGDPTTTVQGDRVTHLRFPVRR
ncbi:dihydrofolate reductase family protein [Modestobacter versicolor]|uniref:Dihydrofolate reductase n=1 Tax=Modestobacter versicolor TaxID=429133 RepID=A0A323VA75_9ACTN|nr:dihydrofolate reductase family protein [Modestobacter versicolor]MBB3675110.1 dihydrofolate reductase [Modestobacter versicolor]PZA21020.1 dihydrofolate reductase [Modestobacter versicolor]